MKRSPANSSSSTSSSSSSSCPGPEIVPIDQSEKPKSKRPRKTKCLQNNAKSPNASGGGGGGRRSSIYRGVTRHRWTGRFEAHLWDKSSWNNVQNKKGKQVYLGAYDTEEAAARTYDLAALKYWGPTTTLNFPIDSYSKEVEQMEKVSKEEYLASLRRRSSGFSRGVSKYRGVARHHHNGRWEARIGRVFGNKYLYLGTYNTQEEAAAAYDLAAIEYRGANAVTNFDISNYIDRLKKKIVPLNQTQEQFPSSTNGEGEGEGEVEVEVEVDQQQQPLIMQQQLGTTTTTTTPQVPCTQLLSCIDSSAMGVMEHADQEEHEGLHWSFLDTGFAHLPVPDLPFEKTLQLPDLFEDTGFEDNIDLIFGAVSNSNGDDVVLGDGGVEVGISGNMEDINGQERLLSSSSPSSSTTTSVSCNYSG